MYLTHNGGSTQKAYPKSKKAKYLPLQESGLYKFSLWYRLKQEALCNTLWCLGMMSASRLAGMWEELKAPCLIQTSKLALVILAHEKHVSSFSLNYALPAQRDRADKRI